MPRARHDLFLKRLYRWGLPDALRLFFPEIADDIDWKRFNWDEKEIILPGPRPRGLVADLLGHAPDVHGSLLRLFVHPELQSQLHPQMGWRMFKYDTGIVLQLDDPNVRVLSFVFYHCPGGGDIEERTFELVHRDRWLTGVRYWTVGVADLEAAKYVEEENPMAWGLAAWMRSPGPHRVELKLRLVEKILGKLEEGPYQDVLFDAVQSYYPLMPLEREEERRLLESRENEEVGSMLHTYLGKLESKARREGRQEGRQEALLEVLRSRFDALPEGWEVQVRRLTNPDRLDELIKWAAIAPSLDDFRDALER